jgi:hypothetical protein
MAHTEGPWERQGAFIGSQRNGTIAQMSEANRHMEADARLVVQAPRLLAALERLLDSQRGLNLDEWRQAVAEGRSVIAAIRKTTE